MKEVAFLDTGFEGLMVRSIHGPYKHGRSTANEGYLFKFKRFRDGETTVWGILKGVHNLNEAILDELGRSKRNSHQENKVPSGQIGTLLARDCATGGALEISPGRMTQAMRKHYWQNPDEILERIIKYKTFDYGALNVPRFSTFQDFRHPDDM